MFIRSEGPVGVVSNQGQGLGGPSPAAAFAFDLANPNLFLKQNLHSLYLLSGKQAAFRVGLQNMATGRGQNIHSNYKGLRTESEQYHLRANDFDQSMVWFQNVRPPLLWFSFDPLSHVSGKVRTLTSGSSHTDGRPQRSIPWTDWQ
jgi:hypothetical protein